MSVSILSGETKSISSPPAIATTALTEVSVARLLTTIVVPKTFVTTVPAGKKSWYTNIPTSISAIEAAVNAVIVNRVVVSQAKFSTMYEDF